MKKSLNDRITDLLADGIWRTTNEIHQALKNVFPRASDCLAYLKKLVKGGFIQAEQYDKKWHFGNLESEPYSEVRERKMEELQRKVLEIVKDGEWRMAKEIMELLPDDLKPVSVTVLAKILFKMCDRGELQKDSSHDGRIYAAVTNESLDIEKIYKEFTDWMAGKAVLYSELRDRYASSPLDIDRALHDLTESGLIRKCNCDSAYCGAGYVEDGFFNLNSCFVQMARQTTLRNPYEYMR